ncbi:hypothetical protein V6N11_038943 [Hibiscus sabdariffa]|uniref:25S rRNA (uridine-N(3))-methyltransferase BMT5-like domain-containing protein n=1 Tax=Hibiscus sabdariffa TaxID=183260 RepID=A0ABR2SLH0_9ROSI
MTTGEPINEMLGAENGETDEEDEKWVTHYSSNHQILLVGEGDFSFSLSLANGFASASASNICATSLDSYVVLKRKYKNAVQNLENLEKLGATLLHGVDATKMKRHTDLANRKFDRIIFNFPHAGFCGKEDNPHVIQKHKNLVQGFFRNARVMLRANGEIHINHKTGTPFCLWNLEKLASESSLVLFQCVDFNIEDYPGYHNKRGDGSRCDLPFPLGECSTFKFCFCPPAKKVGKATIRPRLSEKSWHFETIRMPMQQQPTSDFNYPRRNYIVNHIPLYLGLSENSRHFETVPMPMQQQPTSDFNYPQRNHIVNHIPPCVGLSEKSRHFETIPMPMQLQPTSDFNYPQRNHIVNHIPLHAGLSEKSRHFETIPMQLQPTSDFNYPQRNHIVNHIPHHVGLGEKSRHFETIPMQLQPTSDFNYPQRNRIVDHMPLHVGLPPIIPNGNQYSEVFDRNLNGLFRTYERNSYGVACPERLGPDLEARYYGLGRVRHGLETLDRQMLEVPRTLNGNLCYMHEHELELEHDHELRHISNLWPHLHRVACQAYQPNATNRHGILRM